MASFCRHNLSIWELADIWVPTGAVITPCLKVIISLKCGDAFFYICMLLVSRDLLILPFSNCHQFFFHLLQCLNQLTVESVPTCLFSCPYNSYIFSCMLAYFNRGFRKWIAEQLSFELGWVAQGLEYFLQDKICEFKGPLKCYNHFIGVAFSKIARY